MVVVCSLFSAGDFEFLDYLAKGLILLVGIFGPLGVRLDGLAA
jgi:hypothetical protein